MNHMEDKELQKLFEAKRTVEANRRRQEALRQMIEARDKRRSRPLWPVWTGAAAAAIALLLLTMPALFGRNESAPMLVAEVEVPEVQPAPAQEKTVPTVHATPQHVKPAKAEKTAAETIDNIGTIGTIDNTLEAIDNTIETIEEETPAVTMPADVAPTPRVVRRQSTLIACTEGCIDTNYTRQKNDRDIEITFYANNSDATIYSFESNK